MYELMDEPMYRWMDEWMDGWIDGWKDVGGIYGWMDDGWMDEFMYDVL